MLDPFYLLSTTLFSLIGLAYFIYGKKQTEAAFLGAGALLMIYPYFIAGPWLVSLIGLILSAIPFILRRFD